MLWHCHIAPPGFVSWLCGRDAPSHLPCRPSSRGIRGVITQSPILGDWRSTALMSVDNVTFVGFNGSQFIALEACGKCKSEQVCRVPPPRPEAIHTGLRMMPSFALRRVINRWRGSDVRKLAGLAPCSKSVNNPRTCFVTASLFVGSYSTRSQLIFPCWRQQQCLLCHTWMQPHCMQGGSTTWFSRLSFNQSGLPALASYSWPSQVRLGASWSVFPSPNMWQTALACTFASFSTHLFLSASPVFLDCSCRAYILMLMGPC